MNKDLVLKNFPDKETVTKVLKEAPKILKRQGEGHRLEMMEECAMELDRGNVKRAVAAARNGGYNCLADAVLLHFNE